MPWFQDQLKRGFEVIEAHAGQTGCYQRGELIVTGIPMTISNTRNQSSEAGGRTLITSRTLAILIRPEALELAGELVRPGMGDIITADDGRRFKVTADPATKACWQWSDASRVYYRINVDELKSL